MKAIVLIFRDCPDACLLSVKRMGFKEVDFVVMGFDVELDDLTRVGGKLNMAGFKNSDVSIGNPEEVKFVEDGYDVIVKVLKREGAGS